jgi:hypothetical protein
MVLQLRSKTTLMKCRLRQFGDLSFLEKEVLFLSMFSLPAIALLLYALGYKKTKSLLSRFMPTSASLHMPQGDEMVIAHNLARIIHIAARHNIYKTNCLKQSLLLWLLLGRRSLSSEIRIGMQKDSNCQFNAHAWVECNGEPLIDSRDTINRFSAF